jgi:uncharacterized protein YndB with AHSA1/START domain
MKNVGALKITTPNDRAIALERTFDAPRDIVFDAWTKPELLKRWYGPPGWAMPVCDVDLRVGGAYRFVWRRHEKPDVAVSGVFREVVVGARIVQTEVFDQAWFEGDSVVTLEFVEKSGKTIVTMTALYDTQKIRDAILASSAHTGVATSSDRLAELLPSFGAQAERPPGARLV